MIEHVSLDHGWYYFYRIHRNKLEYLERSFPALSRYLLEMLDNCPDEHFQNGPRSSKLKLDLGIAPAEVDTHPVVRLAQEGLDWNHYKTAHSNVQVYMLHNDPQTFAVEAPIWIKPEEAEIGMEGVLSGHIDLLRREGNTIWIWDYKPGARKEKYATTQTFMYALMLSKRTGIPMEKFRCGYFDDETSFIFNPSEVGLEESFI